MEGWGQYAETNLLSPTAHFPLHAGTGSRSSDGYSAPNHRLNDAAPRAWDYDSAYWGSTHWLARRQKQTALRSSAPTHRSELPSWIYRRRHSFSASIVYSGQNKTPSLQPQLLCFFRSGDWWPCSFSTTMDTANPAPHRISKAIFSSWF